jgi:multidrug efflux pump subunit AcrB
MWIVRLALRRPYSFTVAAILIVLMGIVTISRMATDIFPKIDIPVVSVIWSFPGVAPEEMEKRFVTAFDEPRIYLSPDFNPPLRLILSRL